jgi:hypothetical protein
LPSPVVLAQLTDQTATTSSTLGTGLILGLPPYTKLFCREGRGRRHITSAPKKSSLRVQPDARQEHDSKFSVMAGPKTWRCNLRLFLCISPFFCLQSTAKPMARAGLPCKAVESRPAGATTSAFLLRFSSKPPRLACWACGSIGLAGKPIAGRYEDPKDANTTTPPATGLDRAVPGIRSDGSASLPPRSISVASKARNWASYVHFAIRTP